MSLFRYIGSEVTRSYMLEHDQERYTSKREKMYTFMRIPRYIIVLEIHRLMLTI